MRFASNARSRRDIWPSSSGAPWCDDVGPEWTSLPIARLRYIKATKTWSLYWRDRNLRFYAYDRLAQSPHLETLLTELDRDPTRIFWG